jgi:hypothetical protein
LSHPKKFNHLELSVVTAERPTHAERLEIGVVLDLDVRRIADLHDPEVATGRRIPARDDVSAHQRPPQSRPGTEQSLAHRQTALARRQESGP